MSVDDASTQISQSDNSLVYQVPKHSMTLNKKQDFLFMEMFAAYTQKTLNKDQKKEKYNDNLGI